MRDRKKKKSTVTYQTREDTKGENSDFFYLYPEANKILN